MDSPPKVFASGVKPHGWPLSQVKFTSDVEKNLPRLVCELCKELLMNAVMTDCCGVRYCFECIEYHLQSSESSEVRCSKCNDEYETYPDSRTRKVIGNLQTSCINWPACSVAGLIKDLNIHVAECPEGSMDCPYGCGKTVFRKEITKHDIDCERKVRDCKYCKLRVHDSEMENHVSKICAKAPTVCEFCSDTVIREELTAHIETKDSDKKRYEKKIDDLKQRFVPPITDDDVTADFSTSKLALTSDAELVMLYRELLSHLRSVGSKVVSTSVDELLASNSHFSFLQSVYDKLGEKEVRELSEVEESVNILENSVKETKLRLQRAYGHLLENPKYDEDLTKRIDRLQDQIQQCSTMVHDRHKPLLASLDKTTQSLSITSKDGIFVWKIENWSAKLEEGKRHRGHYITSPCFYASPGGYRIQLRLYPNGDRDASDRAVTVYANIMRGPFDPILIWPINKQMVISLIDQSDYVALPADSAAASVAPERADYTCMIRPNLQSKSQVEACKMPVSDSNSSIGFLEFISHKELKTPAVRTFNQPKGDANRTQQVQITPMYIRDDTIFIRVVVEPTDVAAVK